MAIITLYSQLVNFKYSRTSPHRPPWGQRKVGVVERLPIFYRYRCNMTPIFFLGIQHFFGVACKNVTQSKYINSTETEANHARYVSSSVIFPSSSVVDSLAIVERLLWQLGRDYVVVAVLERWPLK